MSWLRFAPAEILLWVALGSLAFLPRDVRRGLRALARRRESVVMAVFLAAIVGGVAVGVENGASLHAAAFDMRLMLFYAAFWPALAALTGIGSLSSSSFPPVPWPSWSCRSSK